MSGRDRRGRKGFASDHVPFALDGDRSEHSGEPRPPTSLVGERHSKGWSMGRTRLHRRKMSLSEFTWRPLSVSVSILAMPLRTQADLPDVMADEETAGVAPGLSSGGWPPTRPGRTRKALSVVEKIPLFVPIARHS